MSKILNNPFLAALTAVGAIIGAVAFWPFTVVFLLVWAITYCFSKVTNWLINKIIPNKLEFKSSFKFTLVGMLLGLITSIIFNWNFAQLILIRLVQRGRILFYPNESFVRDTINLLTIFAISCVCLAIRKASKMKLVFITSFISFIAASFIFNPYFPKSNSDYAGIASPSVSICDDFEVYAQILGARRIYIVRNNSLVSVAFAGVEYINGREKKEIRLTFDYGQGAATKDEINKIYQCIKPEISGYKIIKEYYQK